MRRQSIVALVMALVFAALAGPLGAEEERQANPAVAQAVERLGKASSMDDILAASDEALRKMEAYEDYEEYILGIKNLTLTDAGSRNADILSYVIADARLRQLDFLSAKNDIESGRIYIGVSDQYYNEALEYLDRAAAATKSKDLALDIYLLKFIVSKDRLQTQRSEAIFEELVNRIVNYGETAPVRKRVLDALAQRLDKRSLHDEALRLKTLYVAKADTASAQEVTDDIKAAADRSFEAGNMKEADRLYEQYINLIRERLKGDDAAARIAEIAEKYAGASNYKKALRYYELYAAEYSDQKLADYCTYRTASCLLAEKEYARSMAKFEEFLGRYPNSVWFDKAFESLSTLYYMSLPSGPAIMKLQDLTTRYYRKGVGDYATILTALLDCSIKDFDGAMKELKKVGEGSPYAYTARQITDDIASVKKGAQPTYFSYEKADTYKMWEPFTPMATEMAVAGAGDPVKSGSTSEVVHLKVKPGTRLTFTLEGLEDTDRFSVYLQDKDDQSRLPKKLGEETTGDLIAVEWASEGGAFADDKQTAGKVWQAPDLPGTYKVSAAMNDLGVVRAPDKGIRKDSTKALAAIIVVAK